MNERPALDELARWTVRDSSDLYDVRSWGQGYFSVNDQGNIQVHPERDPNRTIDLARLIETLKLRGLDLPVLVRFPGIVQTRLGEIAGAFRKAIEDHDYKGSYHCVYPIKVNQQRQVVEEVYRYGRPYGFGLEAGSKPELMAVMAVADNDTPIICNGFKDDEFIELALLARKIGRNILPVVEKASELDLIIANAQKLGVRPAFGIRVKLASKGSGRWKGSAGYRSKFGLTVSETCRILERLNRDGLADCLHLLHFHLGSQITDIRPIKAALNEAARIYVELAKGGAGLKMIDVGGGLGIDYDGSQTNFQSSVNYTLQEYANDVIYHIQSVCDEAEVPHPTIVSESGRAILAFHSVLMFNVVGMSGLREEGLRDKVPDVLPEDYHQPLQNLHRTYRDLTPRNAVESLHDAQDEFDTALTLFNAGFMQLAQRSDAENLFFAICRKAYAMLQDTDHDPEDLDRLEVMLADTYFCNFSLFQSIPDSWAIKQLFPIMPIHRLKERPTRRAVLGDITCDSDGKIDQFIDRRDVKRTLPLHDFDSDAPYYLGTFLVGAYQEILGDLHNLFGDTHAVHVSLDEDGEVVLESVVKGDTVREVLDYVEFSAPALLSRLRTDVEAAVRSKKITDSQAGSFLQFYESGMNGYTYLEDPIE